MQPPLAGLTRHNFARELLAGVTLLAIAVPLNIGYAQIAGLPPTAGLYALIVPTVVYVFVISSRQVVASPDAAAAALVASSVGGLAVAGSANYAALAMAQAILSGVLFALMAIFRLGFLANFLSKPILVGFVAGLALDILVSQLAKMTGIKIDSGGEFAEKVSELVSALGTANVWSLVISAAALAVLLAGRRFLPGIPWALVVLVSATVVVVATSAESAGVAVLGEVPAGPPVLTWPVLDVQQWLLLVPSAIALTMVTTAEGLLVARAYAQRHRYPTSPNRDLLAFGVANIAAGASGSFAVGSSTSRTAAMDQAGSRTQLPSLVLAVGTLFLLLFGTALLADIPSPAIGAVVAVAIVPLLGIKEFAFLWRLDRFEFAVAAVCFLVTLLVGAIPGIVVAFVFALINLARRSSRPPIDVLARPNDRSASLLYRAHPGDVTAPGLVVIRMAAPLYFANGALFTSAVQQAATAPTEVVRSVVLDMEAVTDVDITAAEEFEGLRTWAADNHITLSFSRVRPEAEQRLRRFGVITNEQVYATNREATTALSALESTPPTAHEER